LNLSLETPVIHSIFQNVPQTEKTAVAETWFQTSENILGLYYQSEEENQAHRRPELVSVSVTWISKAETTQCLIYPYNCLSFLLCLACGHIFMFYY